MRQMLLTLFVVFAAPVLLVNCNSNKGSGAAAAPATPATGVNASNYGPNGCIYTTAGCLPQGTCPTNFGMQGLECLPATGQNGYCAGAQVMTQFGCLSQESCPQTSAGRQAMYEGTCVAEVRQNRSPVYR